MSEPLVLAVLIGIGIVAVLVLVAFAARTASHGTDLDPAGSRAAVGMSAGMLFGAALGTIVWISTGQFVFWVVFTSGGMVSGLAIGQSWAARHR